MRRSEPTLRVLLVLLGTLALVPACGGAAEEIEDDAPLEGAFAGADKADTAGARWAITASSVEALKGSLASVTPAVRTADAYHKPEYYLGRDSALGPAGPIGAWGPLGALGPVGDNTWNPSFWFDVVGDWSKMQGYMSASGGPLSENGPLGPSGPLSTTAYGKTLPAINDFAKQLQAGGVWTVLGPLGPSGPLGPLGPLGPIGAHGFARDAGGNYTQSGARVRQVRVPYQGKYRTYDLCEKYTEAVAKAMTDNDTSFMVIGSLGSSTETDLYAFTSPVAQYVTITVVPENALSDFDVELLDGSNRVIAASRSDGRQFLSPFWPFTPYNSGNYIDFIQLPVTAKTKLKARVSARSVYSPFPTYRLIVVGSTAYVPASDIKGAHQLPLK